jgi:hypothetical protein
MIILQPIGRDKSMHDSVQPCVTGVYPRLAVRVIAIWLRGTWRRAPAARLILRWVLGDALTQCLGESLRWAVVLHSVPKGSRPEAAPSFWLHDTLIARRCDAAFHACVCSRRSPEGPRRGCVTLSLITPRSSAKQPAREDGEASLATQPLDNSAS